MPPSKRKRANQSNGSKASHVQRARAVQEGECGSSSATSMDVDGTSLRARVCSRYACAPANCTLMRTVTLSPAPSLCALAVWMST